MSKRLLVLGALGVLVGALPAVVLGANGGDTRVSVGSPAAPFAQSKQNEPAVAVDANTPRIVAAGANEEIDVEACNAGDATSCPFTNGVGTSGVYFSLDGGHSWVQPTYTGWTARDCLGPAACVTHVGPIGTLPKYYENGLVSDGDPSLAFGPKPGPNGFSWGNGSRLYYANLASRFPTSTPAETFKGFEAIAVSRTDDVASAAAGNASAWMAPVIVSKQNSTLFADHEQVWADNAQSSPYFGNVYVCYAAFRGQEKGNALPNPITVARSQDGGDTWKTAQVSDASNNVTHGQQDCWLRTSSSGIVYVFWEATKANTGNAIYMARSSNGGQSFGQPQIVSTFTATGLTDPVSGDSTIDGVAGARGGTFPTADIANGAPTGQGATDEIVVAWQNGTTPSTTALGPNESVVVAYSTDGGATWSSTTNAVPGGDRPNMPAIAISPDGGDVYLAYNAFLVPWQTTTANPRLMQSVVRHATTGAGGAPTGWADLFRGPTGDARGASANSLADEFLGDYNNAAATNDAVVAVYVDVRNAASCAAVNVWRQSIADGSPGAKPAPNSVCPAAFGNTDIYGGSFSAP